MNIKNKKIYNLYQSFLFYLNNTVYSVDSIVKVHVYLYICMNNIIYDCNKF